MKIYTEINYQWLDGQLVKTDSKHFEYNGEVSRCMPGVASGIASGVSGIGTAASGIASTATGTASQGVADVAGAVGDVAGEAIGAGMDELGRVPGNVLKIAKNPLGAITGGAMNATEGVGAGATAIGDGGKGALGKLRQNNPFLAAKKGKKSGRGSAKFRRPTSSLGKINK